MSPGALRRFLTDQGIDPALADQWVQQRSADVERWVELGYIPPSEDPRVQQG